MQFRPIDQDRVPPSMLENLQTIVTGNAWYSLAQLNDAPSTTANTTGVYAPGYGPRLALGSVWWDQQTGNAYQYVKAGAGLTVGQVVSLELPTAGTVTAAGSTTAELITNINTTNLGSLIGDYLWTLDAVGTSPSSFSQNLRVIKGHTTGAAAHIVVAKRSEITTLNTFDADVLPSVPANGSAAVIIRPYRVIVGTASNVPVGICMGTVTSGNYTIIQVAGLAMVAAKGDGTALAAGSPCIVGASGVILGATAGATPYMPGSSIIALAATSSATVSLHPCYVNFLGA